MESTDPDVAVVVTTRGIGRPLPWFEALRPRHLEIILEIKRRLLDEVGSRVPGDSGRVAQ
jgi:hypothetical protein